MESTQHMVKGLAVQICGQGPGLVLLHANGGDHRDFEAIVSDLARTWTVYAIDWPGHGGSDLADYPTAIRFAELLPEVLEEFGSGPFALMGNSVGGFAALRTAITRPDLVSQLVLVDPGGFTPRSPLSLAVCRVIGSERIAPMAMRQLPRLYLRKSNSYVKSARARAVAASREPSRVSAFASMWRSFADPKHDGRAGAESLAVPTLLIWGTRYPVLPWTIDGRRATKALPRATVVTLPCGHQPYLEMPREFIAALDAFLEPTLGSAS
jgi:pimeloyl-ACP methyl ester carboxylesterase